MPVKIRSAYLFALVLAGGCADGGSGGLNAGSTPGVYCSAQLSGAAICYGYSNLTSPQQSAVSDACTRALMGTVTDSCPSGEIGCCSVPTGGYTTTECYYTGSLSTLQSTCSAQGGKWSRGTSGGGGATDGGSSADVGTSTSAGPTIESLTASPTVVTPAGTTVSAIVSDTNGISVLAGGTLTDATSGTTYGAFGTPGGQGTFTYTLTWEALNAARPIQFGPGGTNSRPVIAKFFDNEGRTTSQSMTLTLACSPASDAACNGECVDSQSDAKNCGACGNECHSNIPKSPPYSYPYARCVSGACVATEQSTSPVSCDSVCATQSSTCVTPSAALCDGQSNSAQYPGIGDVFVDNLSCSDTPPAYDYGCNFSTVVCCCRKLP